jgi:hypothetical protein
MRRAANHLLNELRMMYYIKRRYWFETVGGLVFFAGLFSAMVYAVLSVSGKSFASGELDTMTVGFLLWLFASHSYSSAAKDVAEETHQRTIEQLYIVPLPVAALLGLRTTVHLLSSLFVLIGGLAVIDLITANRLKLDIVQVLGAILLAAPALIGVGYVIAGLLLLLKKAEIVHALMYFALISLVALPAYPVNALALLPYALASAAVKAAALGAILSPATYLLIAANSLVYLAGGLVSFHYLEKRARKLGVIGHW